MKKTLLASTLLTLAIGVAGTANAIVPGGASLTDAQGNTWLISPSGSIQKNGSWVPGGGGTSALTIQNGTVYGEDSSGKGWFTLNGAGQYWTPSSAPSGVAATDGTTNTNSSPGVNSPNVPTASATPPAPAVSTSTCAPTPGGAATGSFTTANGQIIGPDGKVFVARGIDVMEGQEPSLSTLGQFPGINFVRYAIYDYASPATLAGWVNSLTAAGIVVEIEDHNNGAGNAGGSAGTVFTGQQLASELSWYSSVASAFKGNPAVWFGTNNEPSENPSASALSTWQQQTYQAIRGTGNSSPIMLEANGWASNGKPVMLQGYNPAAYAGMTGTIWDPHFYGWLTDYSTDQATNNSFIAQMVQQTQQIASADGTMPVLIGEYGNSTTGAAMDPNGSQVLTAVQSSGLGSAAWAWAAGNPGDGLANGGGGLSSYGQEVAGYIALTQGAAASVWAAACPTAIASKGTSTAVAAVQASVSDPQSATPATAQPAAAPPTTSDPTTDALNQAAESSIAQANAIIAAAQAQMQPPAGQ